MAKERNLQKPADGEIPAGKAAKNCEALKGKAIRKAKPWERSGWLFQSSGKAIWMLKPVKNQKD